MHSKSLLILLLCALSLLVPGVSEAKMILLVAQNSRANACYAPSSAGSGSGAEAGDAASKPKPLVCMPDVEVISARYGRASASEQCQSGASVVEESNALPDYEAAEYNGLRAAAPTGPQVESLCFMTATSAASNESDPEFELLRDKCVPCSPSAHGAQALVDRPPLESLVERAGAAPDYDYAGVDGPAGRAGPAASFWASRTARSVLKSGTKTIEKLMADGGWPAALEIHFGGMMMDVSGMRVKFVGRAPTAFRLLRRNVSVSAARLSGPGDHLAYRFSRPLAPPPSAALAPAAVAASSNEWQPVALFSSDCRGVYNVAPDQLPAFDNGIQPNPLRCYDLSAGGQLRREGPQFHFAFAFDDNFNFSNDFSNYWQLTSGLRLELDRLDVRDVARDPQAEWQSSFFYAVSDMCFCFGHASRCELGPLAPGGPPVPHCVCEHNTRGLHCESCLDLHNDLAWKPGVPTIGSPGAGGLGPSFQCVECECYTHANACQFDLRRFEQSGNVSGGVCVGCRDKTAGAQCEGCIPMHWHSTPREPCVPCECNGFATSCDPTIGVCNCDPNTFTAGVHCERCANGYFRNGSASGAPCVKCPCPNAEHCFVDPRDRTLRCRECPPFTRGDDCEECAEGFRKEGKKCVPCNCSGHPCDWKTGKCRCPHPLSGPSCNECAAGFYNIRTDGGVQCRACECSAAGSKYVDANATHVAVCAAGTGQCFCARERGVRGVRCDLCSAHERGPLRGTGCTACGCSLSSSNASKSSQCDRESGQCACGSNYQSQTCSQYLPPGVALLQGTECGCDALGAANASCSSNAQCFCRPDRVGAKCDQCAPSHYLEAASGTCTLCGDCYEAVARGYNALAERLVRDSSEPRAVNESDAQVEQWLQGGADALLNRSEALLERVAQLENALGKQLKTAVLDAWTRLQGTDALAASLTAHENSTRGGVPASTKAAAEAALERARRAIANASTFASSSRPANPTSFAMATKATIDALKSCEQYSGELAELVNRTTNASERALAGIEAARADRAELVELRHRLLDQFELHVRQLNATRVELDELLVELSALEKNLTMARALLASLRQLPYDDARALNISKLIAEATEQLPLAARYATLVAAISANASGLLAHNVAFYKQLDTLEQLVRGLNDTIKSRAAQLSQWMEELSERRLVERINTSNQLYGFFRRTKYTELEAERNRTHDMRRQKEQMAKELAELRSKFGKCLSEAELGGASMQNLTLNETIMLDHANETIEEELPHVNHSLHNSTLNRLSDMWGLLDDIMRYRVIRFQNFSDEVAIFADLRAHAAMLSAKAYTHLKDVSRLHTDITPERLTREQQEELFEENPALAEELEREVAALGPEVNASLETLERLEREQDAELGRVYEQFRARMHHLAALNNTIKFLLIDPLLIVCNYSARSKAMKTALKVKQMNGNLSSLLDKEALKTFNLSSDAADRVRRLINPRPEVKPAAPSAGSGSTHMSEEEREARNYDITGITEYETSKELGAEFDDVKEDLELLHKALNDTLDFDNTVETDMERFFGANVKFMDFFAGTEMLLNKPFVRP